MLGNGVEMSIIALNPGPLSFGLEPDGFVLGPSLLLAKKV